MNGLPNIQEGGTHAVNIGALKRRLKSVALCIFNSASESGNMTNGTVFRLLLKGLSGVLNVHVAVGIEGATGFVRPSQVPAGGATMQLTPINLFPDVAKKVYLREVFQDPTATDNADHPLAVDIPFGWEGSTEADQVEIEVTVNTLNDAEEDIWLNTVINGRLVCEVAVEYNGAWWDTQAVNLALSQVTLEGGPDTLQTVETSIVIP